jgi:hypothetical protein
MLFCFLNKKQRKKKIKNKVSLRRSPPCTLPKYIARLQLNKKPLKSFFRLAAKGNGSQKAQK